MLDGRGRVSLDSGKPLKLARNVDIPRAVANLRFFAAAAAHHPSSYHRTDGPNLEVRANVFVQATLLSHSDPDRSSGNKHNRAISFGRRGSHHSMEFTAVFAHLEGDVMVEFGPNNSVN